MIVTWSETYLRTSINTAFNTIRTTPPTISSYLVEPPPPVIERPVRTIPPTRTTTQLTNTTNRAGREHEETNAAARASTVPSVESLQANLPEVNH